MRKSTLFLIPGFVLALALSARAQGEKPITTHKDNAETVKVTVSGRVVLDYVWRSAEMTAFTEDVGPGGPASSDSENTFEGYLGVAMNVDLSDKVSAVVEFGTKRVDAFAINEWGGFATQDIVLREARVNIADFVTSNLNLQIGVSTWMFDVRGRGSSFAFDPRHSQSFTRNAGAIAGGRVADGPTALVARASTPDEVDPVGVWGKYSRESFTLDVVMLPAAIEAGPPSDDEALYAVDFWLGLDSVGKGSKVGGILALVSGPTNDTSVFTLGGGVDLMLMNGQLEVYGQIYFQFGNAGSVIITGPGTDTLDAGGTAFNAGAVYNFGGDMQAWVGASITLISGDDDSAISTDDEVSFFLSYENVNDLMILEDMYFGFDWDSNYFAIKFQGGLSFSLAGGKNNFALEGILGICKTAEDVEFGGTIGSEDGLGNEFDVKARWTLTKQASLQAGVAFLMSSDILEQSMAASNSHQDDSAMLYTVGADLRF